MRSKRNTVTVEHELVECTVGPMNVGEDVMLFRAPVVLDGSGTHKRLPQQVQWEHIQEGDAIFAIAIDASFDSPIIDTLQFWRVIRKDDEESFTVQVNNIVGMGANGQQVYEQMAILVGLPSDGFGL
jgi:hypothetical protein